jgi:hypothetical protein
MALACRPPGGTGCAASQRSRKAEAERISSRIAPGGAAIEPDRVLVVTRGGRLAFAAGPIGGAALCGLSVARQETVRFIAAFEKI